MKKKQTMGMIALGLTLSLFISGCMGTTGRGRLDTFLSDGGKLSIQALTDNLQDYDVYYSGYYAGDATSIIFDRKDDDRTIRLTETSWIKVSDPKIITTAIHGIEANNDFYPRVWKVIGPDNQPYGYLYTGWHLVNVRSSSKNMITITGIPASYDAYRRY